MIDDIQVRISWEKPGGNGAEINKYRVYLLLKNGDFQIENLYCNEENQTIFEQQYCEVPMAELTGPSYGLIKGDLVVA